MNIKAGTFPVALPKADRTIVTPTETDVNVYRITLDKPRGIGGYVSTESAGAMVQQLCSVARDIRVGMRLE